MQAIFFLFRRGIEKFNKLRIIYAAAGFIVCRILFRHSDWLVSRSQIENYRAAQLNCQTNSEKIGPDLFWLILGRLNTKQKQKQKQRIIVGSAILLIITSDHIIAFYQRRIIAVISLDSFEIRHLLNKAFNYL